MAAYSQHNSNLLNHRAVPNDVDFHSRPRSHFGHHEIYMVRQARTGRYVYARRPIDIALLKLSGEKNMQSRLKVSFWCCNLSGQM